MKCEVEHIIIPKMKRFFWRKYLIAAVCIASWYTGIESSNGDTTSPFSPTTYQSFYEGLKTYGSANEDDIEEVLRTTEENIIIVDGRAYLCWDQLASVIVCLCCTGVMHSTRGSRPTVRHRQTCTNWSSALQHFSIFTSTILGVTLHSLDLRIKTWKELLVCY